MCRNVVLPILLLALGWTAGPGPVSAAGSARDAAALWSGGVQPLLDVQCVKCHGPIEQKSGLELDTPEAVFKGGDEGPVVVPGQPEKSRLYRYLAPDSDPHMPPKKQLSDAQRDVVRAWIAALDASATNTGQATLAAKAGQAGPPARSTRSFRSVTEGIDHHLAAGWKEARLKPAPAVDDRTWCRRVYLDLAGRIPTMAELEAFAGARSRGKRAALVDQLLQSEDYAVRMRELWDTFLMGRTKRENHEERRRQSGWWTFLEQAFRTNRPWNETVRDLLVARPDPARPESMGSSWFLYERRNEHQAIAEAVAPVVYGTRIDCAQCHDHPLAREIKQAHYWGLVAAFNRSKNVERGTEVAESATGGFVNFTNLKKESQPALLALLDGRVIAETRPVAARAAPAKAENSAGDKGKRKDKAKTAEPENDSDENYVDPKAKVRVPKYSRRATFADAVTQDNPMLARAFVNRMWAVLFGRGIVDPPDEINARNAPSHPELLAWLTEDFAAHGYDVRRLLRGIALSRAYGLAPAPAPASSSSAANAAPPRDRFAAALERALTAEQLARSWRVAAGLAPNDDELRRKTVAALPDVLPREYNATFQQAQFFTHSPALAAILKPAARGTVERLAALSSVDQRVRGAFLAAFGRAPDAEERRQVTAFLEARRERPAEAVRDLLWALLTSAEFLSVP